MARIDLEHIRHAYGAKPKSENDYALKEVHHEWNDGGAYALLGPSGCGKTTLLNLISGIVTPSRGKILFDGADITQATTQKRNIAQVFQFPVIYDTMTVGENLAFPLKNRGVPAADIAARVRQIADLLDLTPYLNRKATRLTADAKQKISLGRGLVRADVAAVLLQVLDATGCRVVRYHRAQAAADHLAACAPHELPDVLLSDVVMPGDMDGLALAQHVRRRHPGVRIVLMTGYAEQLDTIARQGFLVLPKPCSAEMLANALRGDGA